MDMWVFAYGSLMWQPDFPYLEVGLAQLFGWHRSMCILSHVYRGTVECPGLVFGLDRGGSCRGMAFRIAEDQWPDVRQRLDQRELITGVYVPKFLKLRLFDGRQITGYVFVANRDSAQYWHGNTADAAQLIAQGKGQNGRSVDYLGKTLEQMQELGIKDRTLSALHASAMAIDIQSVN